LRRILHRVRPSGLVLAVTAAMSLVAAAGTLGFPVLTRKVVDELARGGSDRGTITLLAAIMLGAAVSSAVSSYLLSRAGHELIARLRTLLIGKLLRLPISSFDEESTGERVSRVLADCQCISELATRQAMNLLSAVLILVGAVAVLLYLDVWLTLTAFVCVVLSFGVAIPLATTLEGLALRTQDRTARLGGVLTHVLSEIRLVKAFTAEAHERERSLHEVQSIRRLGVEVAKVSAALSPLISLSVTAAILVILVYGSSRVSSGKISIGTLTAFILYIFNVAVPLIQLTTFMEELQKAKGASRRIASLMDCEEEATAGKTVEHLQGTLEFRNVSFRYPGRDRKVLHGLNLVLRPGTTTALVGASGSGKTTILSLIERFYPPTGGAILYDGKPICDFSLHEWRKHIGYVAQSAPIMPGTVRENIVYGLEGDYTDDMVRMAADKAGALEFIEQMPESLETILSEQGGNLSGGQRQRIAIARMFLRNPDILILDEATSSLDSETEHRVRVALQALMQGRTNIIVAHRLATVVHAERICFLEGGSISGCGGHDELLRSHPRYAQLVARQFSKSDTREAVYGYSQ
jgi:ATP-binding cassette, subfamily B, bacterial AbcA/BmrA